MYSKCMQKYVNFKKACYNEFHKNVTDFALTFSYREIGIHFLVKLKNVNFNEIKLG